MTKTYKSAILLTISGICTMGYLNAQGPTRSEVAASILFSDFETVGYTTTEFLSTTFAKTAESGDSTANMAQPFVELIDGLKALGPNSIKQVEKTYNGFLVGAKDFAPPQGIGAVTSHKCYVGTLKDGPSTNLGPYFHQAVEEVIDARQVWTWSIPAAEGALGPSKFYAAQIGASYFLMTNNREDFLEMANKLASGTTSKPASANVRAWSIFNKYEYWVYRSLSRPNGTRSGKTTTVDELSPDVTAIAFFADVKARKGFVRVFSSDTTMKVVPNLLPTSEVARLTPIENGTWQATIPLSKDEAASEALFRVFYNLGFGGYI
jgi:hypothetical protein